MKYIKLASAYVDGSTHNSSFAFIKKDAEKLYGKNVEVKQENYQWFSSTIVVSATNLANREEVVNWFKRYCSHAVIEQFEQNPNNENTFTTGAISQRVNELILFTNNDPELVKERDILYNMYRNPISADWQKNLKVKLLNVLFYKASNKYLDTHTGEDYNTMREISIPEQEEYLQIYLNNLENWKLANPVRKRR